MGPDARSAIARVTATDASGQRLRSTGFLVSQGLVLTAWHVVSGALGTIQIEFPGFTTTACAVPDLVDRDADIAALVCASQPPGKPLALGDLQAGDQSWETFGFPDVLPDGLALGGTITDVSGPRIQLWARELASGVGAQVPGLSGAPCLVDGAAVAIITTAALGDGGRSESGTVFAQPVAAFADRCAGRIRLPDPMRGGLPGLPYRYLPNEPFRFLENYGPEHAELFFGRAREIVTVYRQLSDRELPTLHLLYGQTGVGKSSLVSAGLAPRLEAYHSVRVARRNRSSTLIGSLAESFGAPQTELIDRWHDAETGGRPLIVFLDQAEESFTRGANPEEEWAELLAFVQRLIRGRRVQGKLVLSFRKEWLADIVQLLKDASLPYQQILINRLNEKGVREVVTGLTGSLRLRNRYRLSVEEELDVVIANALLSDPGTSAAPALQVLMTRMWREACERNPNSPRFDFKLYDDVRRTKGLYLKEFLETQLTEVAVVAPEIERSGLALDVLYFCTTGSGTSEARSSAELEREYRHLPVKRIKSAVSLLKDHKLLSDVGAGEDSENGARLMHDALGPFVLERFHQSEAAGQRARRILETKANGWGPDKQGDLIEKTDLEVVEAGLEGMRAPSEAESLAIAASRKAVDRQRKVALATYSGLALVVISALIVFILFRQKASESQMLSILPEGGGSATTAATEPGRATDALASAIKAVGEADADHLPRYPEVLQGLTLALSGAAESRPLCCHDHPNVQAVDFSADGRLVASGGQDGFVRLWDAATGELLREWEHPGPRPNGVFSVAFAWRGGVMATTPNGGTPVLWDTRTPDGTPTPAKGENGSNAPAVYASVRFAHSHDWLVGAAGGEVTVWNSDGKFRNSRPFDNGPTFAEFSPKDDQIAVGFANGTIQRFTADLKETRAQVLQHLGRSGPIATVFFSPGGDSLVTSPRYGDSKVIIWNASTSQPRCILAGETEPIPKEWADRVVREPGFGPIGAVFSPNGEDLMVATWEHLLLEVNPQTCAVKQRIGGHTGSVYSVRYSRDGERVVTAGYGDYTARIWQFGTGPATARMKAASPITSAAFSPRENAMLTGTEIGSVLTWNAGTTGGASAIDSHSKAVFAARYSADGKTFLTASHDGTIHVHNQTGLHPITVSSGLQDVSLSADGKRVLAVTLPRTASEWDMDANPPISHDCCSLPVSEPDRRWIDKASFSPFDKRLLALIIGQENELARIQIFERADDGGWQKRKLPDLQAIGNGRVRSFSRDSRLLATAWSDQKARVFDTQDGTVSLLEGHLNEVTSAVFSPADSTLATGGLDGNIRFWDRPAGKEFKAWGIVRTGEPVLDIDFSGDGKRILALGSDGLVRIYNATPDGFLAQACRWLRYTWEFHGVEGICARYVSDMKTPAIAPKRLAPEAQPAAGKSK
jgi:WD40 repeat protein